MTSRAKLVHYILISNLIVGGLSCADYVVEPPSNTINVEEPPMVMNPADAEVIPMEECFAELCDGLDNDCDSLVDEGALCACSEDNSCYGGPPDTHGVGLCQDGQRECIGNGEYWDECFEWVGPGEEVCDELDNDCDGSTDEGALNSCGACGEVPEETCDEIDNDCDGSIDEGALNACGVCGDVPEETCDGVDNDCDGSTDEGTFNACGACGDLFEEVCDGTDNDCDGVIDEGTLNACGACGAPPEEVCDLLDNDCDGVIDEGTLNACGACGAPPEEVCDLLDNDCDGVVDEGTLNACGACGAPPEEVCDLLDNDCDGVVDEQGCVITDIDINDDCVTVSCPAAAPHPIACNFDFRGRDPRGCVAHTPGQSDVYLQEGNDCGAGRVVGQLICSNIQGMELDESNCPINKTEAFYPNRSRGCPSTD